MDLEKFFDTVNHSKLIEILLPTIEDGRVISLIHKYLNAGVAGNGFFERTEEGVPQGGPLSPLLGNIMLNELDKELERRGHKFVRFADDDKPCSCGCNEFIPESSVFDTWATSSVTPMINAKWGEADDISDKLLPMSLRTQAHEIIRTWAFYTIVKSLYHRNRIPWKEVMISGFVLAKNGEKISKSKGNAKMSPQALIDNHSADVLRYWAANTKLGTDTFFSEEEIGIAKRFITKLWNASKFAISHLQDFNPAIVVDLMPVDRWIIERCNETTNEARKYLNQYEIGSARHEIDDFFWKDFCDYYLEIVKERLYQPELHGFHERRSAQYSLYHCMLNLLKLYGIYVPHITEYIYQEFFKQHEGCISLHQLTWEREREVDDEVLIFGEKLKGVIAEVRKYKSEHNLSMKAEIDEVTIHADQRYVELFTQTANDIKACCRARKVTI